MLQQGMAGVASILNVAFVLYVQRTVLAAGLVSAWVVLLQYG